MCTRLTLSLNHSALVCNRLLLWRGYVGLYAQRSYCNGDDNLSRNVNRATATQLQKLFISMQLCGTLSGPVLQQLLHKSIEHNNRELFFDIYSVAKHAQHHDSSLFSVVIKGLLNFNHIMEAVRLALSLHKEKKILRLHSLEQVLLSATECGIRGAVLDLLKVYISQNTTLGVQSALRLVDSVTKGQLQGDNLILKMLEVYSNVSCEIDVAIIAALKKWAFRTSKITCTVVRIDKTGICCNCNETLLDNMLPTQEHALLRDYFKEILSNQSHYSFQNQQVVEVNGLLKSMEYLGPFDVVVDGLNVTYCLRKKDKYLLKFMQNIINSFDKKLKFLVLSRAHIFTRALREKEFIGGGIPVKEGHRKGVYYFIAGDRGPDDYYSIFAALSSGPAAFLLSNDLFGDHRAELPGRLIPLLEKWQMGRQIQLSLLKNPPRLIFPAAVRPVVQGSHSSWHLPIKRLNLWLCVQGSACV